jgi:hypothetical protein
LGHGTLILIRNDLAKFAASVPCFISHRLVAVRLLIRNVCRFVIIGLYAPTGSSAEVSAERRALIAGIRSVACDVNTLSAKLLVLGDFNEVSDPTLDAKPPLTVSKATPLCELLRGLTLVDTYRIMNPQQVAFTWQPPGATGPARRLDYIFISQGITVSSASVEHMNPLISTDHGVVSCTLRLDTQLPPIAKQHREILLDPGRTLDWGIEGQPAYVRFSTTPSLSQGTWDLLVPLLITAIDSRHKTSESHEAAASTVGLEAAVTSLSNTRSVRDGAVTVIVDHGVHNAAAIASLLALDSTLLSVGDTAFRIAASTSTGWGAFSRAVSSAASLGDRVLKRLIADISPTAAKEKVCLAMGAAFAAL